MFFQRSRRQEHVWGSPLTEPEPNADGVVTGHAVLAADWRDYVTALAADLRMRTGSSSNIPHWEPHLNLDEVQRATLAAMVRAALEHPDIDRTLWDRLPDYGYTGVYLGAPLSDQEPERPNPPAGYYPALEEAGVLVRPTAAGRVWHGALDVLTLDGPRFVADPGREIEIWCLAAMARAGWQRRVELWGTREGISKRRLRRAVKSLG